MIPRARLGPNDSLKGHYGGKSSSGLYSSIRLTAEPDRAKICQGLPLAVHVPFFGACAGKFAHPLFVCAKSPRIAIVDDPAVV